MVYELEFDHLFYIEAEELPVISSEKWYFKNIKRHSVLDENNQPITRVKVYPTYSRYIIGYDIDDKVDYLDLSNSLLEIDSVFTLWKKIIDSRTLSMLNESFEYGDQPLSTHFLLSLAFVSYIISNTRGFIIAEITLDDEKPFLDQYWYKIFKIYKGKKAIVYIIEEKVPRYTSNNIEKIIVKSIKPKTGWFRVK